MKLLINRAGQTLIEILIGITVGGIIIGGATGAIGLSLKSSFQNKSYQIVSSLNQELADNVSVFAEANWRNIYDLNKSPSQYYLTAAGGGFSAASGSEGVVAESVTYNRNFTVDNVNRDANGDIADLGTDDPSTQKITITTSWQVGSNVATVSFIKYLSRNRNLILRQTDWSGGGGEEGPLTTPNNRFAASDNSDFSNAGFIKIQGL